MIKKDMKVDNLKYVCVSGSNTFYATVEGEVGVWGKKILVDSSDSHITGMCIVGKFLYISYSHGVINTYNANTGAYLFSDGEYNVRELQCNGDKLYAIEDNTLINIPLYKSGQIKLKKI